MDLSDLENLGDRIRESVEKDLAPLRRTGFPFSDPEPRHRPRHAKPKLYQVWQVQKNLDSFGGKSLDLCVHHRCDKYRRYRISQGGTHIYFSDLLEAQLRWFRLLLDGVSLVKGEGLDSRG